MELRVPERSNFLSSPLKNILRASLSTSASLRAPVSVTKTGFFGAIYLNRRATEREKELKWLPGDCIRRRPHSPQLSDDGSSI